MSVTENVASQAQRGATVSERQSKPSIPVTALSLSSPGALTTGTGAPPSVSTCRSSLNTSGARNPVETPARSLSVGVAS